MTKWTWVIDVPRLLELKLSTTSNKIVATRCAGKDNNPVPIAGKASDLAPFFDASVRHDVANCRKIYKQSDKCKQYKTAKTSQSRAKNSYTNNNLYYVCSAEKTSSHTLTNWHLSLLSTAASHTQVCGKQTCVLSRRAIATRSDELSSRTQSDSHGRTGVWYFSCN